MTATLLELCSISGCKYLSQLLCRVCQRVYCKGHSVLHPDGGVVCCGCWTKGMRS